MDMQIFLQALVLIFACTTIMLLWKDASAARQDVQTLLQKTTEIAAAAKTTSSENKDDAEDANDEGKDDDAEGKKKKKKKKSDESSDDDEDDKDAEETKKSEDEESKEKVDKAKRGFTVNTKDIIDPKTKEVVDKVEILCIEKRELRNLMRTWISSDDFYRDRPTIELNTLMQYVPEIKTYLAEDNDECGDNERELMKPLMEYLEPKTRTFFEECDKMIADGKISFFTLWYLFPKQSKVVYDKDGFKAGAFVHERNYTRSWFGTTFVINGTYITSNGKHFYSSEQRIVIPSFTGLKEIKKLAARPIDDESYNYLYERGKKYEKIALGIAYKHYEGSMMYRYWMHIQQYKADGRIIIDTVSFKRMNPNYDFPDNCDDGARIEMKTISDENLFTSDPTLHGFSFAAKKWGEFSVSDITDIQFREDAFDKLVLPAQKKHLIRALVEKSSNTLTDMISGKGGGCIFLLHGAPGTGKTLTAEAIAELLHRPLYSISVGELGTTTTELETKLREILEVASCWNAVILLDEADIFLEARNEKDIKRNAMVGQFLRLLEYHNGVLFLTTNRVKCFDKAFHSRISIALKYSDLDANAREQIWKNFFAMANITGIDAKILAKHELNGRQIKNSVRLAQALAQEDNTEVKLEHIEQCVSTSRQFNDDLKSNEADF